MRWDEMAVGHVLGGLDDVDRARFREHLTGCADCRARVEELRDMAFAIERVAATQDRQASPPVEPDPEVRRRRRQDAWRERRAAFLTLVALAIALVGILWLLAAAGRDSELVTTARLREATLEALGSGTPAATTMTGDVRGIVVSSEGEIAWSLTGLPDLADDERIVIWFTDVDETADEPSITTSLLLFGPQQVSRGRLAGSIVDDSTDELRVTVETFPLPSQPTGMELVRADLLGGR
ncbi:MAG TPA: anti-sigma factor [Nitriliruptorales bacterium]